MNIKAVAKHTYSRLVDNSMHRNSLSLLFGRATVALLGFVFWLVAAKRYSPNEIGTITTLLGLTAFIVELSQMGLVNGLIRHMSSFKEKDRIINTVLIVVGSIALLSSFIFLVVLSRLVPNVGFIFASPLTLFVFIAYVIGSAYNGIQDGIFVALRKAHLASIKNVISSFVKILAISVVGGGLLGLYYSITFSILIAIVLGFSSLYIVFRYCPSLRVTKKAFTMSKFSLINYIASGAGTLAVALIPLLIIRNIGAAQAAFYFVAYSIVTLINFVPKSVSQSFFAEASNSPDGMRSRTISGIKSSLLISIPFTLGVVIFGKYILLAFGKDYSQSAVICLQLLAVTSVFAIINYFGDVILNLQRRMRLYLFMNVFAAVSTVVLIYIFLGYGLSGVALGWLFSEILTAIVYLYIFRHNLLNASRL